MQLPLHLENEQQVNYKPTAAGAQRALEAAGSTYLTAYFDANQRHPELAHGLTYEDLPHKFTWHAKEKCWVPRSRAEDPDIPAQIGRMVNINPSADELFYLRMLLKCTPGATSHSDLRTIDGVTHPTYKAACQALNLVENDSQWEECLREAEMISVPRAIRDLFCTIIFDCHPTDPARLFEMFADTMSEDFEHKRSKDPRYCTAITKQLARNDLLCALNENLKVHNQTNDHYGIPMPDESLQKLDNDDEFDPHASEFFAQNMPLLNEEQRELLDTLKRCVDSRKSGCYGLDAPAGCGKKFLNNVLLAYVRQEQNIAIATAMSGIASILLTLGTTFHKRFKPPIKFFKGSTSNIEMDSEEAEVIRKAALILIDEVSMMHRDLLDMLDGLLRTLMDRDEPMGGKLVILLYDFRQLLPVIPREGRAGIVAASVKNSKVWPHFTELKLTRNMRVERLIKENPTPERTKALRDYSEWLLQIGNGTAPTIDAGSHDIVEIPQQMVCLSPEELEAKVYDDFDIHYTDPQYLHKRAILACKNDVIQECNSID